MIAGVKIKLLKRFSDDRGYLSEIMKSGEETFCEIKQTNYTVTYPGVIKAFHWHKNQYDVWFPITGNIQIALYDLREDSATFKETQVVYAGEDNPQLVMIPPHVAHGYRVLGNYPAGLFYHTDKIYNAENPDEERVPYNDPMINFDWQTKFK